ncbi:hypothetical protein [Candidatus Nitrosotenuis uzonensis]|uniref:hypothetical protein n=1 Tax=Candidatus Nitrosotenuis uzonensis TaxID=1407055 RepID=UPI00064FDD54|nr:hypothetical protein [Candidatus Nitrosotenuis uzonensis]
MDKTNQIDLSKLDKSVRVFRFADSLFKVLNEENASFIMKNVTEQKHYHFYQKDGKPYLLLTLEKTPDNKKVHIEIDIKKMLEVIGTMLYAVFKNLERIETTDARFTGKKVALASYPTMFVDEVKRKAAYFTQEYIETETVFEEIETYETAFGAILNENGEETDMIFIRNGEIYRLDLREIAEITQKYEKEFPPSSQETELTKK